MLFEKFKNKINYTTLTYDIINILGNIQKQSKYDYVCFISFILLFWWDIENLDIFHFMTLFNFMLLMSGIWKCVIW